MKQKNAMLSDLTFLTRTKEEQALLESEIELLEKSFYLNKPTAWDEALSLVRTKTAEYVNQKISKDNNKEALLLAMKKHIAELNILTLALGCEPSDSMVDQICEWVRANIGDHVVLDFVYDNSKIAGAEITYGGKVIDLSFGTKISQVIDSQTL